MLHFFFSSSFLSPPRLDSLLYDMKYDTRAFQFELKQSNKNENIS